MKHLLTFTMLILFILSACFPDEDIIKLPPTSGNLQIGKTNLNIYNYQIFYDLEKNQEIKWNENTAWDLGFDCSDSWQIVLNNSKLMYAGNTLNKNFSQVNSYNNLEMKFDNSGGNKDSLALSEWIYFNGNEPITTDYTYVIDRGYDQNYIHLGYRKTQFQIQSPNSYKVKYSKLDGSDEHTLIIEKETDKNFICFSFDNEIVDIEPLKKNWTILFTSYQTMLYTSTGTAVPYLVRGVLINRNNVEAISDTTLNFSEINLTDTIKIRPSKRTDIIGYDWKYYDFDNGIYSVVDQLNYFVKAQDGYFYKLRFISFYNNDNDKGFPTFEFYRL